MLFFSANQKIFSLAESFTNFTQSRFYVQKLLLHMPFFAVRKNFHFHKPKGFLFQKALRTVLKNRLFTYKKPFIRTKPFLLSPKAIFFALRLPFQPPLTYCPQKFPIFTNQKHFFRTNLSLFPPQTTLFHPPLPIRTTLNLLSAKNTAILLISALNSYAVKPERRTDSNHCRRYPAKLQLFAKPVT